MLLTECQRLLSLDELREATELIPPPLERYVPAFLFVKDWGHQWGGGRLLPIDCQASDFGKMDLSERRKEAAQLLPSWTGDGTLHSDVDSEKGKLLDDPGAPSIVKPTRPKLSSSAGLR